MDADRLGDAVSNPYVFVQLLVIVVGFIVVMRIWDYLRRTS